MDICVTGYIQEIIINCSYVAVWNYYLEFKEFINISLSNLSDINIFFLKNAENL